MILPEFLLSNFGNDFDNFSLRLSTRLRAKFSKNNFKQKEGDLKSPSFYDRTFLHIK